MLLFWARGHRKRKQLLGEGRELYCIHLIFFSPHMTFFFFYCYLLHITIILAILFIFISFKRQRDRDRERHRCICWITPSMPQQLGQGQAEGKRQDSTHVSWVSSTDFHTQAVTASSQGVHEQQDGSKTEWPGLEPGILIR